MSEAPSHWEPNGRDSARSIDSTRSLRTRPSVHDMMDDMRPNAEKRITIKQEMKDMQKALAVEGLSQVTFFWGVLNIMANAFVFGRYPHNSWFLYGLQAFILIPAWYHHVIKFRTGHLFILDLCWVMNILQAVYMLLTMLDMVPDNMVQLLFRWFFMNACGFLSWSVVALGNAVIFHSVEKMASLFIHMIPAIVCLTLRWEQRFGRTDTRRIANSLPSEVDMELTETSDLFIAAFVPYAAWWVVYSVWLLTIGVSTKMPTVFGNLYERSQLGKVFSRTGFKSYRSHALIYMFGHALAVSLTFCWAAACWWISELHLVWVLIIVAASIWSGAGYYLHVVIRKLGPALNASLKQEQLELTSKKPLSCIEEGQSSEDGLT